MREHILAWRNEGKHPQEMADLASCSLRTVYYLLSYDQDYGTTTHPCARTSGRPRSLNIGDINYLTSLIAARPKIYLDELQEDLLSTRGIDVSVATISRALRRWEMSNKNVASAALERNELLRATWQAEHGDTPAEYCVWIDEGKGDGVQSGRHVFVKILSSEGRGFPFSLHSYLKELLPLIFLKDQ